MRLALSDERGNGYSETSWCQIIAYLLRFPGDEKAPIQELNRGFWPLCCGLKRGMNGVANGIRTRSEGSTIPCAAITP